MKCGSRKLNGGGRGGAGGLLSSCGCLQMLLRNMRMILAATPSHLVMLPLPPVAANSVRGRDLTQLNTKEASPGTWQ